MAIVGGGGARSNFSEYVARNRSDIRVVILEPSGRALGRQSI
jgi:hypothetical protein